MMPWARCEHQTIGTAGMRDDGGFYFEAHGFGLERYIAEPLQIENGFALAPDRPGHGISFDWSGLAQLSG
jgi:L-alanine-DL-glutamate epimerase-like enolase superfamily enzyme